jgi:archaea-specific RecJ-like exonuclease
MNQETKNQEICQLKEGDFFQGIVKIVRKAKPGPVILEITDGTGFIDAVTKDCNFNQEEVVEISGPISERAGRLQLEIKSIKISKKDFSEIIDEKSIPLKRELSIQSEKLEILKPYFIKIAHRIRRSIIEGQPILIRHHADADGITSGLAIEKACRMLMEEFGTNPQYNLFRSPSKAPFYETSDVLKDVAFTKRLLEGHGQKKPLVLVLDNGSTPEDVFAMKTLQTLGFNVIVVDHHNPVQIENKKTAVCPYVSLHVNPYMEGFNGQLAAGMLSYEIARLIHPKFELALLPAISAIGDRCKNEEAEQYIINAKLAEEKINQIVIAVDFLAYQFRFDGGKGVYEELFENDEFVSLINNQVNKGVETQLQSTLPYLRTQDINGIVYSYIDLEKYTLRFTYPTPGKIIGMIHDKVAAGKKETVPVITIGHLSDMVILRATQPVLPIAQIIEKLQQDLPEANVDGGGHETAGTIKFVSAHLNTVLENIKQQIRNLKYLEKE